MSVLLLVAQALACPGLAEAWDRALDAAVSADAAGINAAREAVDRTLSCRALTPPEVARAWVVHALAARAHGRDPAPWMRAARRVDPSLHDPRVPPSLWALEGADAPASVAVEPSSAALLDGIAITAWPATTTDGPHLLQLLGPDGEVRLARTFPLLPGEDALVETGGIVGTLRPVTTTVPATHAPSGPRDRRRGLRAAALASALGAGAFALAARSERDALLQSVDLPTLDAAHRRQVAWASGAWVLLGTAGVLVGLDLRVAEPTP